MLPTHGTSGDDKDQQPVPDNDPPATSPSCLVWHFLPDEGSQEYLHLQTGVSYVSRWLCWLFFCGRRGYSTGPVGCYVGVLSLA